MVDKSWRFNRFTRISSISTFRKIKKIKFTVFKKPFPSREISMIYYKPTYKQKILDELVKSIKTSLEPKLNYTQSSTRFCKNKTTIIFVKKLFKFLRSFFLSILILIKYSVILRNKFQRKNLD